MTKTVNIPTYQCKHDSSSLWFRVYLDFCGVYEDGDILNPASKSLELFYWLSLTFGAQASRTLDGACCRLRRLQPDGHTSLIELEVPEDEDTVEVRSNNPAWLHELEGEIARVYDSSGRLTSKKLVQASSVQVDGEEYLRF